MRICIYHVFVIGSLSAVFAVCQPSTARAGSVVLEPAGSEEDWEVPQHSTTDAVIVSATPVPQTQDTLGTSVTRISSEDLETAGIIDLSDALGLAPGVAIGQTGGRGSTASLFLRGGASDFALVLIDGIPLNDVGGGFDFGVVDVNNVESIEVVRGAQTALHGADAMSGTVSIVTKKGEGDPSLEYNLYGGTRGTIGGSISHGFGTERGHFRVSIAGNGTSNFDGITNDDYTNFSTSLRAGGWIIPDVLEVDATFRYRSFDFQNPGDFIVTAEDIDDETSGESFVGQVTLAHHIRPEQWRHELRVGGARNNIDQFDPTSQGVSDFLSDLQTRLERTTVDYRHVVELSDAHILTVGYEFENEDGTSVSSPPGFPFSIQQDLDNHSVYAQLQSSFLQEALNVQLGVRHDDNSGYGGQTSPRVAVSYFVKATQSRIHGSYGLGIKNPSIFDLASPFGGNPNLLPEETEHWDIGVEQTFLDGRIIVDVTYFEQDITNLIQTDPMTFMSENIGRARTQGVEISKTIVLNDRWSSRMAYTWLEAVDSDGADLLRRPRHAGHFRVLYDPPRWWTSVFARYQGQSPDADFNSGGIPVTNAGFIDVGIAGGYEINDRMEVYGRVTNAFDSEYQTAFGFQTVGVTAIFGIKGRI